MKGITLQLGGNMDISIKCDSLKAIYSVKNGMLRCAAPYEFTISLQKTEGVKGITLQLI